MYFFRWRKGDRVGALMHVNVLKHIVSLCSRTMHLMNFDETWYGWRIKALYLCFGILVRSAQRRIQGGAKIGYGASILQNTSSDRAATATNRMHNRSVVIFGSFPKSNFNHFWRLVGLGHCTLFKCYFYTVLCLCCKVLINIYLLWNFHVCKRKNDSVKDWNTLRVLMHCLCIFI